VQNSFRGLSATSRYSRSTEPVLVSWWPRLRMHDDVAACTGPVSASARTVPEPARMTYSSHCENGSEGTTGLAGGSRASSEIKRMTAHTRRSIARAPSAMESSLPVASNFPWRRPRSHAGCRDGILRLAKV